MLRHIAIMGSRLPACRIGLVLTVSALALPLASCGGSGSGSTGTPVVIPTPTPTATPTPSPSATPTPSPTPTPTPSATPTPTPTGWAAAAAAIYDTQPNLGSCSTGVLKDAVRQQFLARVNDLRALHNLAPVTYASAAENTQVDEASLIMAVAQQLSHTPPNTWTCYTTTGYTGASTSNLIGGWGTGLGWSTEDDHLAGWMNERYSATIGHRRWILDPFLGKLAYGRVSVQGSSGFRSDAGTMKVFNFASAAAAPSSVPAFVAYPFGDYPIRYFGGTTTDILSFTVIASSASRSGSGNANANVSFANATVQVSNPSNTNLTVTDVASDNVGYGVPNSIQWKVTGLQSNVTYTVRITGITGAPQSSYQYTFRIMP